MDRHLRQAHRQATLADVVDERGPRRDAPERLDERRLRGEVELGRAARHLAPPRLVLRSRERRLPSLDEEQDVALVPRPQGRVARRARGRRSPRPVSGGSRRRRCRCRARRCPDTMGTPSASHACAMPSIASASSQPISGFSGLPKLRQSVKPIGSPPAHATLRAASRTASAPPVNGSSEPTRPVPSSDSASPRHDGRSRSTAASRPGLRTVRDCTSWS